MSQKQQGFVAIVVANVIFGLNVPVTTALMADWMTPMGYTITRMCFGTILFWTLGFFLKKDKVALKDIWILLVGGLLGFMGTQLLFSQALRYTTPTIFSLLMALTPVIVLVLSVLFIKEKLPKHKVIGVLLSISGAGLIIAMNNSETMVGSENGVGIMYAVLCAFCYAGYLMLTRKISMKYHPVTVAKWMFLFSAITVLPFSSSLMQQKIYNHGSTIEAIGMLVFALIFSTTLAFFLMPYALKRIEASTASIFMNLQPIVAAVVAILIGQDVFTWDKPIAVVMVITGVYLVTRTKKK